MGNAPRLALQDPRVKKRSGRKRELWDEEESQGYCSDSGAISRLCDCGKVTQLC